MVDRHEDSYRARLAYAQSLLPRVELALAEHAEKRARRPADWGWTRTMDRAGELLERVLEVLGAAEPDPPPTDPRLR